MIEKEIKKFFNTVSVSDRIPDAWKEHEKALPLLPMLASGLFIAALMIAVIKWVNMQESDDIDETCEDF